MDRGALGLVVCLCRALGTAPVRRVAGRHRVSKPLLLYGAIVATASGLHSMLVIALVAQFSVRNGFMDNIIVMTTQLVETTMLVLGVATAARRAMRMATYLQQMETIKRIQTDKQKSTENKIIASVILGTLASTIGHLFEFAAIKKIYFKEWSMLGVVCQLQHTFIKLLLVMLVAQQTLFAREVQLNVSRVNDSLQHMIPKQHRKTYETGHINLQTRRSAWGNKKNKITVISRDNVETSEPPLARAVRHLAGRYTAACDVINAFNSSDGHTFVLMLSLCVLYTEKNLYRSLLWQLPRKDYGAVLVQFLLTSMVATLAVYAFEPFHRTHAQMFKTHMLVNTLKSYRWNDELVRNELETFVRLLMLNHPKYSLYNLVTLDRDLVLKMYGCVITYFVLMATFGSEFKTA